VRSFGDHRLAMALAIAGLAGSGEVRIEEAEAVSVSYPAFWDDLERISG
jgi:3-phosphoshikimate 1-carboxyvinyltransferase